MKDKFFLDTNILIYAVNFDEPKKQKISQKLIKQALESHKGIISFQVIQEFLNVVTTKIAIPIKETDVKELMETILTPLCEVQSSVALYYHALTIKKRYKLSFYDSLIIAAAINNECTVLYSEDLQNGQKIESLKIVNPFKTSTKI